MENLWGYKNPWDIQEEQRRRQRLDDAASTILGPKGLGSVQVPGVTGIQSPAGVSGLTFNRPKMNQPTEELETAYLDYNNPMEINSFADLFLAPMTRGVASARQFFEDGDLGSLIVRQTEALYRPLTDPFELIYRGTIKPIAMGRPMEGLLNAVTNLGETSGIAGNVVKGLLFDGPRGLARSVGLTGEGRYNYDWDVKTGGGAVPDTILNIALEVLSDPLSYVTFGAEGVARSGLSTMMKGAYKSAAKQVLIDAGEEVAEEALERTAKQVSKNAFELFFTGKAKTIAEAYMSAAQRAGGEGAAWISIFNRDISMLAGEQTKAIAEMALKQNMKYLDDSVYAGLAKIGRYGNQVDTMLARTALQSTGLGLAWLGARQGYEHLNSTVIKRFRQALGDKVDLLYGTVPLSQMDTADEVWVKFKESHKGKFIDPEIDKRMRETMTSTTITSRMMQLQEFARKYPDPAEAINHLDEFFNKLEYRGDGDLVGHGFKAHLKTVEDMAQKYPSPALDAYLMELKAIDDHIADLGEYLKRIAEQNTTEAVLKAIRKIEQDMLNFDFMKNPGSLQALREVLLKARVKSGLTGELRSRLFRVLSDLKRYSDDPRYIPVMSSKELLRDARTSFEAVGKGITKTLDELPVDDARMVKDQTARRYLMWAQTEIRRVAERGDAMDIGYAFRQMTAILEALDNAKVHVELDVSRTMIGYIAAVFTHPKNVFDVRVHRALKALMKVSDETQEHADAIKNAIDKMDVRNIRDVLTNVASKRTHEMIEKFSTSLSKVFNITEAFKAFDIPNGGNLEAVLKDLGFKFEKVADVDRNGKPTQYFQYVTFAPTKGSRVYQFDERFRELSPYLTERWESAVDDLARAIGYYHRMEDSSAAQGMLLANITSFVHSMEDLSKRASEFIERKADLPPLPPAGPAHTGVWSKAKGVPDAKVTNAIQRELEKAGTASVAWATAPQEVVQRVYQKVRAGLGVSTPATLARMDKAIQQLQPFIEARLKDIRWNPAHPDAAKRALEALEFIDMMLAQTVDEIGGLGGKLLDERFVRRYSEEFRATFQDLMENSLRDRAAIAAKRVAEAPEHLTDAAEKAKKKADAKLEESYEKYMKSLLVVSEDEVVARARRIELARQRLRTADASASGRVADEVFNELKGFFDDAASKFQTVLDNASVTNEAFTHYSNLKSYFVKRSQVVNFWELQQVDGLQQLSNLVRGNDGLRKMLIGMSEDDGVLGDSAKNIIEFVEGFESTQYLLRMVERSTVLDDVQKAAFLDVLQSYATSPLAWFRNVDDRRRKITKLIETMERQIKGVQMTERFSQEALTAEGGKFGKFYDSIRTELNELHDAKVDTKVNMITFEDLLEGGKGLYDPKVRKAVFIDTETTDLNDTLEFLQLVIRTSKDAPAEEFLSGSQHLPKESVMRMLVGMKERDKFTREQVIAAFRKKFVGDQTTAMVDFLERLNEMDRIARLPVEEGGEGFSEGIIIVGHNIEAFDLDRIRRRVEALAREADHAGPEGQAMSKRLRNAYQLFTQHQHLDTYVELERKYSGFRPFKAKAKQEVSNLVNSYVVRKGQEFRFAGREDLRAFIPDTSGKLALDMQEISHAMSDAGTLDPETGKRVGTSKWFNADIAGTMGGDLRHMSANIFDNLQTIKLRNQAYFGHYITQDMETKEWVKGSKRWFEPGVLHINQIFKSVEDAGKMAEFSSRMAFNGQIVSDYFNIPEGYKYTRNEQLDLTTLARKIDKYRESIRNPDRLEPQLRHYPQIVKDLQDMLVKVQRANGKDPTKYTKLKALTGDVDEYSMYATALHLYKQVKHEMAVSGNVALFNKRFLYTEMEDVGLRGAYELLERPELIRQYAKDIVDSEKYFTPNLFDEGWEEVENYNKLFDGEVKSFEELIQRTREPIDAYKHYDPDHAAKHNFYGRLLEMIHSVRDTYLRADEIDKDLIRAAGGDPRAAHVVRQLREATTAFYDHSNRVALWQKILVPPADLIADLWHNCDGVMQIFHDAFDEGGDEAYRYLLASKDTLEELGVHMEELEDRFVIWLDKKKVADWRQLPPPPQKELLTVDGSRLSVEKLEKETAAQVELLRKGYRDVDGLTDGAMRGSNGATYTASDMLDVRYSLPNRIQNELIPTRVFTDQKNLLIPAHLDKHTGVLIEEHYVDHFSRVRFNHSTYGSMKSVKSVHRSYSMNGFKNLMNTAQYQMLHSTARVKDGLLFFDRGFTVKHLIEDEGIDMQEMVDALKEHGEFVVAAYIEGPSLLDKSKTIRRTVKYPINNVKDLQEALDAGAVVMHQHMYTKAYQTLTDNELRNPVVKFWTKYFVAPMRAGMLTTLGFPVRNFVDTAGKTMAFAHMNPQMARHVSESFKVYNDLATITRDLLTNRTINQEFPDRVGFLTPEKLARYYELKAAEGVKVRLSKEMFEYLQEYMNKSYSGGIIDEQMDQLIGRKTTLARLKALEEGKRVEVGATPLEELLYQNRFVQTIFDTNSFAEHAFRLATFSWDQMNNSATFGEASAHLLRTHFDYGTKSKAMVYLESVIPFANFTVQNLRYWADELTDSLFPWSMLLDAYRPMANQDEYSLEDVAQNFSLQARIVSGNLVIDDETGRTLKLNPSFMDALATAMMPQKMAERILLLDDFLGGVKDGLNGANLDWETVLSNLPYAGPFYQRMQGSIRNFDRTKDWRNLVFGSLYGSQQKPAGTLEQPMGWREERASSRANGRPQALKPLSPRKSISKLTKMGNMTSVQQTIVYGLTTPLLRTPHFATVVEGRYGTGGVRTLREVQNAIWATIGN